MNDLILAPTHVVGRRHGRRSIVRPARRVPADAPVIETAGRPAILRREAATKRALIAADVAAALAALLVVGHGRPALLVLAPLLVLVNKVAGLYDRDDLVLRRSTLDEVPQVLQVASVFALCVAAIAAVTLGVSITPEHAAVLWLVSAFGTTTLRFAARTATHLALPQERCLVVGDADHIADLREKLESATHGKAKVVAAVALPARGCGLTRLADLQAQIERHDVHRVVIAPLSGARDTTELVRIAKAAGVRVSLLPGVVQALGSAVEVEHLAGLAVLGVRRFKLSRSSALVKRAFDLMAGTLVLLAVGPLLLVLSLAVRLDSRGPVLFRQVRIGRDGKPFGILKFRSMVDGADALKHALLERNEVDGGMFKMADDPRVTRVGRLLRRTSLDELPQILNVLRGDMSLVGPRPLVTNEDALVEGIDRLRLSLTPGMTGPWQVLGATRVPLDEMVGIDCLYVANWSLWADVKLLCRTVPHVLLRRGL